MEKKRLVIGVLAHADAGKTTLSESLFFNTGAVKQKGRVDYGDAFLDTDPIEKEKGITIFSKTGLFKILDAEFTLLDTPGHSDFALEMEKTLQVLDLAILLISQQDGLTGHTELIWKLLKDYRLPCFIFVNKMDQEGASRERSLKELQKLGNVIDFSDFLNDSDRDLTESFQIFRDKENFPVSREISEEISLEDERLLEKYIDKGYLGVNDIKGLIKERRLFPVFFGSALKEEGIKDLLKGLCLLSPDPVFPLQKDFRVFKTGTDEKGKDLSFIKVTGGVLRIRDEIINGEKITEMRLYNGPLYKRIEEALPGMVIAIPGRLKEGESLSGKLNEGRLQPLLDYRVCSEGISDQELYRKIKRLNNDFPELKITFSEETGEVHIHIMGEVQLEIIRRTALEKYGLSLMVGEPGVIYRETIKSAVVGLGHFEPLRHFAEIRILIEPAGRNEGISYDSKISTDVLKRNWQRLCLTHLQEKRHRGVLTGSELTDVRFTLIDGRAHIKHTEGGDFREAVYRAVRQGLMQAESIILEPYFDIDVKVPRANLGRVVNDINMYGGSVFESLDSGDDSCLIKGRAPVRTIRNYQREINTFSRGRGNITLSFSGYYEAKNQEEIIRKSSYNPDNDLSNPSGSVFVKNGTGYFVPWYEVAGIINKEKNEDVSEERKEGFNPGKKMSAYEMMGAENKELEEIFLRTYGPPKERTEEEKRYFYGEDITDREKEEKREKREMEKSIRRLGKTDKKEEYLLVDGYNMIFSDDYLRSLLKTDPGSARGVLSDRLSNYAAFTGTKVILVFDAYRVQNHTEEVFKYLNITVVFTREQMTADMYIELAAKRLVSRDSYNVTVATGDQVIQVISWGAGARIMSPDGFFSELKNTEREIRYKGSLV